MNILKRLASLFSGGGAPRSDKRYLTIYVLSRRCNEPISGQVDLLNELSKPDEGEYAFYTRKVLHTTGENRCFSQVEINLYFNADKQIVHHDVEGGRWLSSEEYSVELDRFNAPPPEDEMEEELADDPSDKYLDAPAPTAEVESGEPQEKRTEDEATSAPDTSTTPTSQSKAQSSAQSTTEENDHA